MHIGLVGGIGPTATVVYYRSLVGSFAAAGRKLALTIVNADVREMTDNLEAGRAEEQAAIFAGYVDQLRAGGCEIAALTSMGGHFCIRQLEARTSLPLIGAIPALENYFAGQGISRIGLMGTRTVMESGLYGLRSAKVIVPPADELKRVHDTYLAIAKAGVSSPEQRAYFQEVGLRLYREEGVDVVVLGGTDLSSAFDGSDPGYPVVDSAIVHANAIARAALSAG